ncbi:HAD family hydrolase [Bifidobacterium xylocopae]|uniref:HAD family hydrolase n=1 Tax=Bifidobacterium xylocopae TaxID=2493119 RepID=A0A366KGF6_9BIFI|nr:HAD family phosphatase [Bifidobacterium xylocopae]RBP99771.1 HAD family hydrolase [Bifidobacterium xylocopae]
MSELDGANGVENVIFGFGGVLVDWEPRSALEGLYPAGVIDMVLDRGDKWGFWRFNELADAGWSQERILADYESDHGPAVAWVLRTYFEHIDRSLKAMIPGMGHLLDDLAGQGAHTWGLANASRSMVDAAFGKFAPMRRLEGIVVSAEEGLRKPDPLIYQVLLRRWRLEAGRSVFVDDRRENVDVAQRLGMRGLLFTDARQLREDLRGLGLRL